MEIEPGTVVANRYRISRAIGRGGMGEVFAAENIRTGRPVAVKLLRADSKSKSSAVERFRREARAAGSINSDHVTQVLDIEDDAEHGIVLVFELLEGESLIDRLKRTGPIPFDELHPIIEEVWVGLSDAHKVGIIHRDLKPSNVFLERRPDGHQRVKILDFGISKLPKEMGGETLTEMGQSLGTFSFMPPEQIGRAKTVDHRADIYATTTMIYQSLTGQLPYVARNILVMVELKSKTNPRPLSEALGHPVDQALEQFVTTGLARNPADRFQNALDALEKWRALKSLQVPESRRAMSMGDLNAQARAVSQGPLPAAGRPASGVYSGSQDRAAPGLRNAPTSANPSVQRSSGLTGQQAPASGYAQSPTGIGPAAHSGQGPYARQGTGAFAPASVAVPSSGPPALVVPALDQVMPGSLPRLYDQTESTTDVSHIELVNPLVNDGAAGRAGAPSGANPRQSPANEGSGVAQRGQELRGSSGDAQPEERQGPQGTRVLPPTIVQQAVAAAEARKASQADLRKAAAQAQGAPQQPSSQHPSQQHPQSQAHASQQQPQLQQHPSSHGGPQPQLQQHPSSHGGPQPQLQQHPSSHGGPQGVHQLSPPPRRHEAGAPRPASSRPPPLTPLPSSQVPASGVQPTSQPPSHGSSAPPPVTATAQSVPSPDPRFASQPPQSPRVHLGQAPTPFPGVPLAQVPTPFPGVPAAQQQPQPQQGYSQNAQGSQGSQGSQSAPPTSTPPGGLAPFRQNGPVLLSTQKLPDEPSSIPASQDKTTVYRPKQKKPAKKQSMAVFVIGALLFAIVGFGIVFLVQYLVKTLGTH